MSQHVITYRQQEMWDFLGLDYGTPIERIDVSFSPMMNEWSVVAELPEVDREKELDAVRAATEKLTEKYRDSLDDLAKPGVATMDEEALEMERRKRKEGR